MPRETPDSLTARLTGPRPKLDPRRHIARPDLVDIALAGDVAAARYVAPVMMRCAVPRTAMRKTGDAAAVAVSELLFGENFDVFEYAGGWAFGRSSADCYTGWVRADTLGDDTLGNDILGDDDHAPRHRITAPVAPVFSLPDIKAAVSMELPFGALVTGTAGERFFALTGGGFIHVRHLEHLPLDPVAVARRFTGAPYLWGGRTPAGVDCSGLVQAALTLCGIACPRDSDQQLAEVGSAIAIEHRAAGDLVFFPGHVGILATRDRLFHANAHWMATVEEPLADVIARLEAAGSLQPVSGLRRL